MHSPVLLKNFSLTDSGKVIKLFWVLIDVDEPVAWQGVWVAKVVLLEEDKAKDRTNKKSPIFNPFKTNPMDFMLSYLSKLVKVLGHLLL